MGHVGMSVRLVFRLELELVRGVPGLQVLLCSGRSQHDEVVGLVMPGGTGAGAGACAAAPRRELLGLSFVIFSSFLDL
jgi:hypothetical protein